MELELDEDEGEVVVVLLEVGKTLRLARTGALEVASLTAAPAPKLTCERSKCGTGAAGVAAEDKADAWVGREAGAKK